MSGSSDTKSFSLRGQALSKRKNHPPFSKAISSVKSYSRSCALLWRLDEFHRSSAKICVETMASCSVHLTRLSMLRALLCKIVT
jgi:hypothetical protein